jgi:hypothetical protein
MGNQLREENPHLIMLSNFNSVQEWNAQYGVERNENNAEIRNLVEEIRTVQCNFNLIRQTVGKYYELDSLFRMLGEPEEPDDNR